MHWKKLHPNDHVISYIDAKRPSSMGYGNPGKFVESNGEARLEPDAGQLKFIKFFAVLFIPAFTLGLFLLIPGNGKWLALAAAPTLGLLTFGLAYFLVKNEIKLGPYILFSSKTDEVTLPRIDKTFARERVVLQWISGRSEDDPEMQTDLNLIVDEDGSRTRYFVMGGPYRNYVKQFADYANLSVVEVNAGWRGRRDIDASAEQ